MCWSTNHDVIHYVSSSEENIDTTSPIAPGQSVLLHKGGNEFKVRVFAAKDNTFKGTVMSVGPIPGIEINGISRGQTITFDQTNVFHVYRDTEAEK